ncbi:MAG TPA: thiamine-phosphate kinase, partial [Stellaceae bacterium]|nr:thiamine-phosphate kinase [Stellaceae bacterium]
LVVTVDAIVEGVHYLPNDLPDLVARKLLRVNLSDLAAKGARPLHYLLTTALPPRLGDDWVARFAAGLGEDQRQYGVALLGGDSVSTPGPAVLSLTAIGEVVAGAEIRRGGAKPGDRVWVSGTIGDAFLGLRVLRGSHPETAPADREFLAARFRLPEPRVRLGPRLSGIAHAMCDISDGLVADLGHICEASGVGATISLPAVPLSPAARRLAIGDPVLAASLATGGDDYELLFAAPPDAGGAIERLAAEMRLQITAIGTIETRAGVRVVDAAGALVPVASAGWTHF